MLYIFLIGGIVLSLIFDFRGVQNTQWYLWFTATLLAIGLYSSTFGISIKEARQNLRLILSAVTIGVFVKALIIGSVMSLLLQNPFGFILGIIMAQIDPLSTVALLQNSRLSKRAKTIITAWSSFDDPVTVILSLYAPVVIALASGSTFTPIAGTMQETGLAGYLGNLGSNVLFAMGALGVWLLIKKHAKAKQALIVAFAAFAMYVLLVGSFSLAIYYFLMLGIALLGLFMRPPIEKLLSHIVRWALAMAAVLLGVLLINGIDIINGLALGFVVFLSQIIVGLWLTRNLPPQERISIAFSQQNGITAIVLSLLFEAYYPGTIAIIAPAIIVTNIIHALSNNILNAHFDNDLARFTWPVQREKIKVHMKKI